MTTVWKDCPTCKEAEHDSACPASEHYTGTVITVRCLCGVQAHCPTCAAHFKAGEWESGLEYQRGYSEGCEQERAAWESDIDIPDGPAATRLRKAVEDERLRCITIINMMAGAVHLTSDKGLPSLSEACLFAHHVSNAIEGRGKAA